MSADPLPSAFAEEVSRPDGEINLARAALLIALSEFPDLDIAGYLRRLDELALGVGEGGRAADPLQRLHRLREYLFEEQGFAGNIRQYYDPRNSYLNEVLDRRLGIPITLSLVMIEVGRRLGLEMEGIGLPGHFITGARLGGEHVLLDPFNGGTVLTGESCGELVGRALGRTVTLKPEHFQPVGNRQFLTRMLANLKSSYWRGEQWDRVIRVIDQILVLNPSAGSEWRDRGVAWSNMGLPVRGLADWERYLTSFPHAADHDKIKGQLRRVREKLARLN